jgi:geranylgeranyl transferase type-1 subunit beta
MFAYFTIAALELLGILQSDTKEEERKSWIDWVYSCQIPEGGFRGGPYTDLKEQRNAENQHWDPPSIPGTYFALATLLLLGDDLERVKRRECLQFLKKMQRPDGSFGETLGANDKVEGNMDTRLGYTAMGIRWILRGRANGAVDGVEDVRLDQFVQCIRTSETYDGGISELAFHEAHGGFTFCAIAALYFAGRLPPDIYPSHSESGPTGPTAPSDLDYTIQWLISRQTLTLEEDDEEETQGDETDNKDTCHDSHSIMVMHEFESERGEKTYESRLEPPDIRWVGYNGRPNKIADTCYTWWVAGALDVSFCLKDSWTIPSLTIFLDPQACPSLRHGSWATIPPRKDAAPNRRLWKIS